MSQVPEIIICLLIISCIGTIYIFSHLFQGILVASGQSAYFHETEYAWIFRLGINCFGYASIFVPGFLIHKYVRKTKYLDRSDGGFFPGVVRQCFEEPEVDRLLPGEQSKSDSDAGRSAYKELVLLAGCFIGLMASYLTWGLLQEKVMTQNYENASGKARFKDSQFLVFVNRILAFVMSGVYIMSTRHPRHKAPLYKYAFCSFSNVLSAWCQYEALKYVSFPTQVLAKACKIIPVMMMGKIVSRNKYEYYEYVTAGMISTGMIFFMIGSSDDSKVKTVTTISGVILLAAYMMFDSFTATWQGALFTAYSVTPVQMMCGVNLFSCLFTGVSLAQQNGFGDSLQFMADNVCIAQYPAFMLDCLLLSISSAAGQLFIFFTIATFGPIVFTIIMTLRQGIAILLSCITYQHHISILGSMGIMVVFAAVFLRVYCKQRLRALRTRIETAYKSRVVV